MKSVFDELKDLIDYIDSLYLSITDEWHRSNGTNVFVN